VLGAIASCSVFDESMRRGEDTIAPADAGRDTGATGPGMTNDAGAVDSAPDTASVPSTCTIGTSRECKVPPSTPCNIPENNGAQNGVERCLPTGSNGFAWGPCECTAALPVPRNSNDCTEFVCPPQCPHPVGCSFTLGTDQAGACVARTNEPEEIYVREGNSCSGGQINGLVYCSTAPATAPIGPLNCPTDRATTTTYAPSIAACP
jgi:hypothetical protein